MITREPTPITLTERQMQFSQRLNAGRKARNNKSGVSMLFFCLTNRQAIAASQGGCISHCRLCVVGASGGDR